MLRAGLIALALVVAPTVGVAAPVAVLESYVGERPKDADVLLAPVHDELGRLGYTSASALRQRADARMSRPGDRGAGEAKRALSLTTRGYDAWLAGRIEEAATLMGEAVDLFQANPAAFATATERRQELMKALVILALARKRLGKVEESARAMAELVRSFPDMPLDHRTFGPEASALYKAVARDVASLRRGRLRVESSDERRGLVRQRALRRCRHVIQRGAAAWRVQGVRAKGLGGGPAAHGRCIAGLGSQRADRLGAGRGDPNPEVRWPGIRRRDHA
jgi:hypothetical protein